MTGRRNIVNNYLLDICHLQFKELGKSTQEKVLLSELADVCYGKDHKQLSEGPIPVYGSGGIMRYVDSALCCDDESILIPRKGSLNNITYVSEPFWSVDTMFYTRMKKKQCAKYLYFFLKSIDMEYLT